MNLQPFTTPHSLQIIGQRLVMPYDDLRHVSLIDRCWDSLDRALIERAPRIALLTDAEHTPADIATRLLKYSYDYYTLYVAEHPGNKEKEHIYKLTLAEAAKRTFEYPYSLALVAEGNIPPRHFGIPDDDFDFLNKRSRIITKAPIRLMIMNQMELQKRTSFWDIGFCTGAVAIEAKLQFPHLQVTAFEIRPEGKELMEINSQRFGTPGITSVIADFMRMDLYQYLAPDAVFIGGNNGRLKEMILYISEVLLPGGIIVMNSIQTETKKLFKEGAMEAGLELLPPIRIALEYFLPIEMMRAVVPQD